MQTEGGSGRGIPVVIISYSHADEEWKDRFSKHLGVLESHGYLAQWHDRKIDAGDDWLVEIETAFDRASVAVLLVSASSLTSDFILQEEVTTLLRRRDEEGLRIIPVLINPCDWEAVDWLKKMQLRPKDGRVISGGTDHQIDQDFADIAKEIRSLLDHGKQPAAAASRSSSTLQVSIGKLPMTGEHLFGRELELERLDEAWRNPQTNVISLVAWGVVGKSALVKHWLGNLAPDYRGAQRVYGWSFFSQGTRESEASADEFINAALRWFGDPDPTAGSPTEKAERLAGLIQRQKTLLILDGLEPLQNPPGPESGKIKDAALAELLRQLDAINPGLCVITTRVPVLDLLDQKHATAPVIDLGELSDQAGAELLHKLGVAGEQEELERASHEFRGHSLALNLLGTYLRDVLDGDVRRRKEVSVLVQDKEQGGHARRVMVSYEHTFGESPELAILHILGLFDRPVRRELVDVLRASPAVPGLNDALVGLSNTDWQHALARLRRAGLLAKPDPTKSDSLDTHPLVREHFGARLKERSEDAWREGHNRLYEHLKDTTKEYPDTLEEMAPLFQAVFHGCRAGRHQQALEEVFFARVRRRNEAYSLNKMGAIGADLAAVSAFFDAPFSQPAAGISDDGQGFILNEAGFCLRALGRLREAIEPMEAGAEIAAGQKDWSNAAAGTSSLSELHLTLGEVAKAVARAEESVAHADQSGDAFLRMACRTALADARHQAGERERALALFEEAEALQAEWQPPYPRLYSLQGFQYCDLLLDLGRQQEVRERAAQTLELVSAQNWLLDIALDHLSLGRAELVAWQEDQSGDLAVAEEELNQAVDGLRQAGSMDQVPHGLLARAALYRETEKFDRARRDLDEVLRIAKRSEMRLFECDAHLEAARLHLAHSNPTAAHAELDQAKALIDDTGYHRRDRDVEEIEEKLGGRA